MAFGAPVAQWTERGRPKACVGGSSPSGGAKALGCLWALVVRPVRAQTSRTLVPGSSTFMQATPSGSPLMIDARITRFPYGIRVADRRQEADRI